MPKALKRYVLSEEADSDLDAIFDYTENEHSFNQAVSYLNDLEAVFKKLLINPEIGRKRDDIKKGLFSLPEQEHTIFYRFLSNTIKIVRVLHSSRDLPQFF
ncbi:MAG: type II toxin-antitoxin system RelE/ParE family toxin [Bacteroidetes bacterium]|nr:type II toxin-antitoxin system RelE/ParE family toxin [Bacteroidota bacterium]